MAPSMLGARGPVAAVRSGAFGLTRAYLHVSTRRRSSKRRHRQPVLTTNNHGQPIVLVPLVNHPKPARIDAKDFEMLLADGYSDQWNFNQVVAPRRSARSPSSLPACPHAVPADLFWVIVCLAKLSKRPQLTAVAPAGCS